MFLTGFDLRHGTAVFQAYMTNRDARSGKMARQRTPTRLVKDCTTRSFCRKGFRTCMNVAYE